MSTSLLVISVDNTILNVALPSLQGELGATTAELQWVLDAYMVVFAGLLLCAGSLGDRFGRRRALQLGLLIFGAASAAASLAGSTEVLIAARAVMGVGAAFVMPATLSIITNAFTDDERPKAIAIWAAVGGLVIALGPLAGGWLLEHFWWGSVFLVNVPIVLAALVADQLLVDESRDPVRRRPDAGGAVLSVIGVSSLVYGIIQAPVDGWSHGRVAAAFIVAVVSLVAFVAWERQVEHPMLELAFFRNPRFTASSVSITLVFFGLFGSIFVLTQYLQLVLGYTALEAGVRTVPVSIGLMMGAGASAKLAPRMGSKAVVAAGLMVTATGLGMFGLATPTSGYRLVLLALLLQGFGMGAAMATATEAVMGSLPPEKAGVGSGVNDTTRLVGGAIGVAVVGTVLAESYAASLDAPELYGAPPQVTEVAESSLSGALQMAASLGPSGTDLASAARLAFTDAMAATAVVASGVAILGAAIALRWLPASAVESSADSASDTDAVAAGEATVREWTTA